MTTTDGGPRGYYDRVTSVDLGAIAREVLAGRIVEDTATYVLADCPRHASQSRRSLRIDLSGGLWYCFGCGVGGDVLQLVEFVRAGVVTRDRGTMSASHRDARDFLAAKVGLPPLSVLASRRDAEREEGRREESEAVFGTLSDLADAWMGALLERGDVLRWLLDAYGFDEAIVRRFRVGWAPGDGSDALAALARGRTVADLVSTGAFGTDTADRPVPFFRSRVVFPYLARGGVVNAIGRRTPWTENVEWERAKYKKLPVHDETRHVAVSRLVDNSVLWGEDVLLSRPAEVVLTEGITDAISSTVLGWPTVSPVTTRIRRGDVERVVRRLRGVGTVYVVQDNELSGIGEAAAIETARLLEEEGVACRVATLPLAPDHVRAREGLAALVGEDVASTLRDLPPAKRGRAIRDAIGDDPARAAEAEGLLGAAKADLADWFRRGGDSDAFRAVLAAARDPVEVAVDRIPLVPGDARGQVAAAEVVLAEVGRLRAAARDDALRRIKDRTGIPLATLRQEATAAARRAARNPSVPASVRAAVSIVPDAEPGSCRELVERSVLAARAVKEPPDWRAIAEDAFRWFESRGAQFFRTRVGVPAMFWESRVYWMRAREEGPRAEYEGMMYDETGTIPTSAGHRTFSATFSAIAARRGRPRDQFGWLHTDVLGTEVHIALANDRNEVVRISHEGVEVVPNGTNARGVILRADAKFDSLEFDEGARAEDLDDLLDATVGRNLACSAEERRAVLDWVSSFPLLEFSGTRPMARFEGRPGSGKTWAAKMLTTMIFGHEEQKKATDAANFADAARNPVVAIDNVETANRSSDFVDFLLTSVTGIVKEKRAAGTDSATIAEKPLCLILTTGVEPLAGELEEIMSRAVVMTFREELQTAAGLLEKPVLAGIAQRRPRILSALFRRTSVVLSLIRDGGLARAIRAIRESLGRHGKRRCDEYFGIMYLQRVAAAAVEDREGMLEVLDPGYAAVLRALDDASDETAMDASPIATGLLSLFVAIRANRVVATETGLAVDDLEDVVRIRGASTGELFLACRKVSKDRGSPFPYTNPVQFGRRLSSSIELLVDRGFAISRVRDRRRGTVYDVEYVRGGGRLDEDAEFVDKFSPPDGNGRVPAVDEGEWR
uniref:Putative DNA primase n=1 Tax=viral metagenome TaxID=1070528 RepID=A0A6M3J8Y3_9ZZZZ